MTPKLLLFFAPGASIEELEQQEGGREAPTDNDADSEETGHLPTG